MRVEQAIYGEIAGRGHGLRTSSTNAPVVMAIASQLDLPDAIPPGVQGWSPFIRGFPVDDQYVLARTFLDSTASRGGMALTHALIVSLEDMCQVPNIDFLFAELSTSLTDCPDPVAALELTPNNGPHELATDLIGTANAIAARESTPVVRLGITGFENLICSVWRNLWPDFRRTFAFRLSFSPKDIVETCSPVLVCTPEQLQARWATHTVIKPDAPIPDSEPARILCGQRDVLPILTLAAELGLAVDLVDRLNRLERLYTLISGDQGFENLLNAVRLADGLSKTPETGTSIKRNLIRRLTTSIAGADCKQLLLMRNLALSGFPDTALAWSAFESRVSNLDFRPVDDSDLIGLVTMSVSADQALLSWRLAVSSGIEKAAQRGSTGLFKAIWRWAEHHQAAFGTTISILPADHEIEQRLLAEVPHRLKHTNQEALLAPLLEKQWLVAHGAVLAATLSPLEAIAQQLKVDRHPAHSAGLQSALLHASPSQTLECTLKHQDSRLIELCAEIAATHPDVLSNIDCMNITEQKVWATSIGKSPSLWSALSNPTAARDNCIRLLTAGQPTYIELLQALAKTPLADLSMSPDRPMIWSLLPEHLCNDYLQATASSWIGAAARGEIAIPLESILEKAIISSTTLDSVLAGPSTPLATRLSIISSLQSYPEDRFIPWIDRLINGVRHIPLADSEQLGALMATRRWARATKHLVEKFALSRQDLNLGLRLCAHLINRVTAWMFGISKLTTTEKWQAFEEEASELYPNGPDDHELWSRAGGKNADLPGVTLSGATRWYTAVHKIRYGGGPKPRDLIAAMQNDFPTNPKLRLFANDTDIVGRR